MHYCKPKQPKNLCRKNLKKNGQLKHYKKKQSEFTLSMQFIPYQDNAFEYCKNI